MLRLFVDTETTGLPNNNLAPDHPSQCHVVQFAAILTDNFNPIRKLCFLINPGNKAKMSDRAFDIHKISLEKAMSGKSAKMAVEIWHSLLDVTDEVVAHNLDFDMRAMRLLCQRVNMSREITTKMTCTMETAKPILKLTTKNGALKRPSLAECMMYFYHENVDGAHDALVDTTACMRIYQAIHAVV